MNFKVHTHPISLWLSFSFIAFIVCLQTVGQIMRQNWGLASLSDAMVPDSCCFLIIYIYIQPYFFSGCGHPTGFLSILSCYYPTLTVVEIMTKLWSTISAGIHDLPTLSFKPNDFLFLSFFELVYILLSSHFPFQSCFDCFPNNKYKIIV